MDRLSTPTLRPRKPNGPSFAGLWPARLLASFRTANEVCEFVSRMVRDLAATNSVVLGGALLEPIAQISPGWCAALLEELLETPIRLWMGFYRLFLGKRPGKCRRRITRPWSLCPPAAVLCTFAPWLAF